MKPQRIEILGVPVDVVTMKTTLEEVKEMVRGSEPQVIIAINPEKVLHARRDPVLLARLRSAGLLIPDGIGVVNAARIRGARGITRVAGADLMPAICGLAEREGYAVFLLGARPEANAGAVAELRRRFPALRIAGHQHGYLSEAEMPALVKRINDSGAQILFIAMGSPKQELWMDRYLPELRVKVCQGVGGTFDVLSGIVNRAPVLFQRMHLEWFYRDFRPKRLARIWPKLKFAFYALFNR
jgi:N-acetylglucosaminyldiphosphoundecaprenol N-acetyl-beta-D-mannosaminyltransferase